MKTYRSFGSTRVITAILLTLLAMTDRGHTQTWTKAADMPTGRRNMSAVVVDGNVYVIGGTGGNRVLEAYNPATDTWTTKADMPTGRILLSSSTVNGKIYAMGGTTSLLGGRPFATVEEYDPATDIWTTKADMPSPRGLCSASEVNGIIYLIGGRMNNVSVTTVEAYDPAADTWTMKADMPTPRQFLSTAVVNGKIYAIGGVSTSQWPALSNVEEYDPETDTWTTMADIPAPRGASAVSVINDRIYFLGGTGGKGYDPEASVFEFDPAMNTWAEKDDLPVSLGSMTANTVAGSIYLIGGSSASFPYDPSSATVWKFTPDPDSFPGAWPDVIPIDVLGFEAEGIALGNDADFFVGAFSYSDWFGAPTSVQAGSIYKGNLRTGNGSVLVEATGTPIAGLSHDPRTDYLYVAKGSAMGGVLVYNASTGDLVADIAFAKGPETKVINDVLVTETCVYCTESTRTTLYKVLLVESGALPAEPVVELLEMNGFVKNPDPTQFNANGLVASSNEEQLIVVNASTGILFLADVATGSTTPIKITGDESVFPNGDGLYLDGSRLYVCQNFSNKIAVIELSDDLTQGTFVWNLLSPNLNVPTTITGLGDSIYAINTHFGEIAAGNQAELKTEVVKLSNIGVPSIKVSGIELEGSDKIQVSFKTSAPVTLFDFFLESNTGLSGSWMEDSAEMQEGPDTYCYYFQIPLSADPGQGFYRVGGRKRLADQ